MRGRPKKDEVKQTFAVRLSPKTIEFYRANRGLASKVLEDYKHDNEEMDYEEDVWDTRPTMIPHPNLFDPIVKNAIEALLKNIDNEK